MPHFLIVRSEFIAQPPDLVEEMGWGIASPELRIRLLGFLLPTVQFSLIQLNHLQSAFFHLSHGIAVHLAYLASQKVAGSGGRLQHAGAEFFRDLLPGSQADHGFPLPAEST